MKKKKIMSCYICDAVYDIDHIVCYVCDNIVCCDHYDVSESQCWKCTERELNAEEEESEEDESEEESEEEKKDNLENTVFRYEGVTDEEKDETKPTTDEDKCPICLDPIGETMYIRCNKHSIHIKCMNSCKKMDCPICRCNFFDKSFIKQMNSGKIK